MIRNCDTCQHWRDMPKSCKNQKDFNNCSKGHKMKFKQPKEWADLIADDWGFHLRSCKDYAFKAITPKEPIQYGKIELLPDP